MTAAEHACWEAVEAAESMGLREASEWLEVREGAGQAADLQQHSHCAITDKFHIYANICTQHR